MVEVDSLVVFNWIKGLEEPANNHANVIQECKEWLQRGWIVNIRHVLREGNLVADKLAKLALKSHSRNITRWLQPPEEVDKLIFQDLIGSRMPRRADL